MPRPISLPNKNVEQYCTIDKNKICDKLKTQIQINTEIDIQNQRIAYQADSIFTFFTY